MKDKISQDEILAIIKELKEYLDGLEKQAIIMKGEAMRALDRFCETKEQVFYINGECIDIEKFLVLLNKTLNFNFYSLPWLASISLNSEKDIILLDEKIDNLSNFLFGLPGSKFTLSDVPKACKKFHIVKKIVWRDEG